MNLMTIRYYSLHCTALVIIEILMICVSRLVLSVGVTPLHCLLNTLVDSRLNRRQERGTGRTVHKWVGLWLCFSLGLALAVSIYCSSLHVTLCAIFEKCIHLLIVFLNFRMAVSRLFSCHGMAWRCIVYWLNFSNSVWLLGLTRHKSQD